MHWQVIGRLRGFFHDGHFGSNGYNDTDRFVRFHSVDFHVGLTTDFLRRQLGAILLLFPDKR